MPSVKVVLKDQMRLLNRKLELGFFCVFEKFAFDSMTVLLSSNYTTSNATELLRYFITTTQRIWRCQDHFPIILFQRYSSELQASDKLTVETTQTDRQQKKRLFQAQEKRKNVLAKQRIADGTDPVRLDNSHHYILKL